MLAQMGLSGQTLFANSDGTISVDGSLLTIQGQPVQLAGHVPSSAFGYHSLFVCLFVCTLWPFKSAAHLCFFLFSCSLNCG